MEKNNIDFSSLKTYRERGKCCTHGAERMCRLAKMEMNFVRIAPIDQF
jgi:hypothetical protein